MTLIAYRFQGDFARGQRAQPDGTKLTVGTFAQGQERPTILEFKDGTPPMVAAVRPLRYSA